MHKFVQEKRQVKGCCNQKQERTDKIMSVRSYLIMVFFVILRCRTVRRPPAPAIHYSNAVTKRKNEALSDDAIAEVIEQGYARKHNYGEGWEEVDINDIVSVIAPGSKPVIEGGKIKYYSLDGKFAVVCDVSGYLRVEDLTKKTRMRQYVDKHGKDAHNVVDEKGKKRGRSKSDFLKTTHYNIKKKEKM